MKTREWPTSAHVSRSQYRHGTTMVTAAKTLYKDGGVLRFYRGYLPALVQVRLGVGLNVFLSCRHRCLCDLQGPLSRFGDTAANAGALAMLEDVDLPVSVKTACASVTAGLFRIFLMPVDALKTSLQVRGKWDYYNVVCVLGY